MSVWSKAQAMLAQEDDRCKPHAATARQSTAALADRSSTAAAPVHAASPMYVAENEDFTTTGGEWCSSCDDSVQTGRFVGKGSLPIKGLRNWMNGVSVKLENMEQANELKIQAENDLVGLYKIARQEYADLGSDEVITYGEGVHKLSSRPVEHRFTFQTEFMIKAMKGHEKVVRDIMQQSSNYITKHRGKELEEEISALQEQNLHNALEFHRNNTALTDKMTEKVEQRSHKNVQTEDSIHASHAGGQTDGGNTFRAVGRRGSRDSAQIDSSPPRKEPPPIPYRDGQDSPRDTSRTESYRENRPDEYRMPGNVAAERRRDLLKHSESDWVEDKDYGNGRRVLGDTIGDVMSELNGLKGELAAMKQSHTNRNGVDRHAYRDDEYEEKLRNQMNALKDEIIDLLTTKKSSSGVDNGGNNAADTEETLALKLARVERDLAGFVQKAGSEKAAEQQYILDKLRDLEKTLEEQQRINHSIPANRKTPQSSKNGGAGPRVNMWSSESSQISDSLKNDAMKNPGTFFGGGSSASKTSQSGNDNRNGTVRAQGAGDIQNNLSGFKKSETGTGQETTPLTRAQTVPDLRKEHTQSNGPMPSRGASPGNATLIGGERSGKQSPAGESVPNKWIDPEKLEAYKEAWNESDSGSETPPNSTSPQIHTPSGNASGPTSKTRSAAAANPSQSAPALEAAEKVKSKKPGRVSAGQGSSGSSGRPSQVRLIPHVDDAGGGPLLPVPPKNPPARGYRPTPSQRISSGRTTNEKSPISGEGGANSSRSRTYKSEVASKVASNNGRSAEEIDRLLKKAEKFGGGEHPEYKKLEHYVNALKWHNEGEDVASSHSQKQLGDRGKSTAWPEGSQKQMPEKPKSDPTTQPETKQASQPGRIFETRNMPNGDGKAVATDDVRVEFVDQVDKSLSGQK